MGGPPSPFVACVAQVVPSQAAHRVPEYPDADGAVAGHHVRVPGKRSRGEQWLQRDASRHDARHGRVGAVQDERNAGTAGYGSDDAQEGRRCGALLAVRPRNGLHHCSRTAHVRIAVGAPPLSSRTALARYRGTEHAAPRRRAMSGAGRLRMPLPVRPSIAAQVIQRHGADPASNLTLGIFFLVTLAGLAGGGGRLFPPLYVGLAVLAGLVSFYREPGRYVAFVYGLVFFTPWVRRVGDFQNGINPTNVVLLAPVLVALISALTLAYRARELRGSMTVSYTHLTLPTNREV